MQDNEIDQEIETLLQVSYADGKERYAEAQFNLGLLYQLEKKEFDNAVKHYTQVLKNDSPESYAMAQLNLGFLYQYEKKEFDNAEKYYVQLLKEDLTIAYAMAQFNLGCLCQLDKKDFDNAVKHYNQVLKDDLSKAYERDQTILCIFHQYVKKEFDNAGKNYVPVLKKDLSVVYATAQFNLGLLYQLEKKDFDNSIKHYTQVLKEDSPEDYARAECNLGALCQFEKKEFDNAVKHYNKVLKKSLPEAYARAQLNLGRLYQYERKEFDNAEKYYAKVLKEDSPEAYIFAQIFLGILYQKEKKEFDNAQKYYTKVLKNDSPEAYVITQFYLGELYYEKKNFDHSTKYYNNVEYLISDQNFNFYICSQVMLNLIKNNNQSFFKNDEDRDNILLDKLVAIRKCAIDIQQQLLITFNLNSSKTKKQPERRVAHYTKPRVLFDLLKGQESSKPSHFRLNVVDFMNDPSENQILTNWLNIPYNSMNDIKTFLASFTFNHNSLNQFRLYGNEGDILGSGISIAFNQRFFCQEAERSINPDGINRLNDAYIPMPTKANLAEHNSEKVEGSHPLPLFRCLYFDPKSEYIALAKRNKHSFYLEFEGDDKKSEDIEQEWNDYINALHENEKIDIIRTKLNQIKETVGQLLEDVRLKKLTNLQQLITLALMPISCLIKHAAFEDEDECRIIYTTHIADDKIQAPQHYQSTNSLFIEYATIEPYIDNIYLGPQCQAHHHLWLTNHITKTANKTDIKVIKSTMPLR